MSVISSPMRSQIFGKASTLGSSYKCAPFVVPQLSNGRFRWAWTASLPGLLCTQLKYLMPVVDTAQVWCIKSEAVTGMDVFLMIRRKKTTIFIEAKESST